MSDNQTQLVQLKLKVEKLINLHSRLMNENHQLKMVQNQLNEVLQKSHQQLLELEEKNKLIKMAQAVSGNDQNTRELKLKINEYIREIDKCLALINR
jgi:uncharacterized membrane protein YccC